uniref:Sestrin 4 n=1 Tax=Fundulus heteroclitus TaxID=8078 RepID=A0A3Q2QQK3_FUNHE
MIALKGSGRCVARIYVRFIGFGSRAHQGGMRSGTRRLNPPAAVQSHVMVNGEKERVSLLFMKALVSRGSVDAVSQQMASHPQYLESFLRTQHYILHMDGPLPLPYRHYIAIMAAARYHCSYLVCLHSAHFLRVGGDPLWLQGLEAAPPRLRLLDHINKVLAHQPWLATCSHIQTLLKAGEPCWSLAELVQAVVILAHCHSLCSFVFGCDNDSDLAHLAKSPNGTPPTFCPFDAANGNANVPQSLRAPSEHITRRRSLDSSCDMVCLKERIQKSQEEQEKREERLLQTQTLQQTDLEDDEEMLCLADPSRFVADPDFCYQEFARRDEDHLQVLRVQVRTDSDENAFINASSHCKNRTKYLLEMRVFFLDLSM